MVARCEREGLLGVCLTSSPLSVGARCPFIKANVGAVSTQAYSDPGLGPLALRLLELGYSPEKVLRELKESDAWSEYSANRNRRQKRIVRRVHGREEFGLEGRRRQTKFCCDGQLPRPRQSRGRNGRRLRRLRGERSRGALDVSIEAGRKAGGERGGHLSSALVVFGRDSYARTDLRVDMFPKHPERGDAVDELRRYSMNTNLYPLSRGAAAEPTGRFLACVRRKSRASLNVSDDPPVSNRSDPLTSGRQ